MENSGLLQSHLLKMNRVLAIQFKLPVKVEMEWAYMHEDLPLRYLRELRTFLRVSMRCVDRDGVGAHNQFESYQMVKAPLCLWGSNTKFFAENLQLV